MKIRHCALGLALTIGFLPSVHAGVTFEISQRDAAGKLQPLQAMQAQGGQARMETLDADRPKGIIIFKNDALHVLDPAKKSYVLMDKATIEQFGSAMSDAMAMMQKQMASLPPEQRAMMENMMKQRGMPMPAQATSHTFDAQATGASEKVDGISCRIWNVTRDGQLWQQLCAASDLPGQAEFMALGQKMRPLFEKLAETIGKAFSGNPIEQNSVLADKIKGVPLITRRYQDGKLTGEEVVIGNWKEQAVAASQFEIPAGYTKQELPTMRRP